MDAVVAGLDADCMVKDELGSLVGIEGSTSVEESVVAADRTLAFHVDREPVARQRRRESWTEVCDRSEGIEGVACVRPPSGLDRLATCQSPRRWSKIESSGRLCLPEDVYWADPGPPYGL